MSHLINKITVLLSKLTNLNSWLAIKMKSHECLPFRAAVSGFCHLLLVFELTNNCLKRDHISTYYQINLAS